MHLNKEFGCPTKKFYSNHPEGFTDMTTPKPPYTARNPNPSMQDFVLIPPDQWLCVPVGIEISTRKIDGNPDPKAREPIRRQLPLGSGIYILDLFHFPQHLWNRVILTYPDDASKSPFVLNTKVQLWLTAEDKVRWDEVADEHGLTPTSNLLVRFERCLEHKERRPNGIYVKGMVYYKLVDVRPEHTQAQGDGHHEPAQDQVALGPFGRKVTTDAATSELPAPAASVAEAT